VGEVECSASEGRSARRTVVVASLIGTTVEWYDFISLRDGGMILAVGVIHAWFYGAQGTLYASLYPARIRYTGLSAVYQLSGIYASGLTPLILVSLIAADHGSPWYACAYLVTTVVLSVGASALLEPS
jgi:hypothetical protein